MDLVTFLRERLDEDEATARLAEEHGWSWKGDAWFIAEAPNFDSTAIVDLLTAFNPARVLREVAAKRALAEHCAPVTGYGDPYCIGCSDSEYSSPWPCWNIRTVAAVYADHPDYDKEWTP